MSKVYLIGAGPGDPGLLTVKAKEIIEQADVIIYDYLANPAFLKYAKKNAEVLYVGKKAGAHTLPQEEINKLIVKSAQSGKMVARLKGGDPYVFGRGGEEAEELVEAGVEFEVVPGVTAGVAAAAYAGIPVTHRDYTTSVCFITGHEDPTKEESGHSWEIYAKSTSTLVFYMGVKNLPMIAANLIKHGRPADTPVALVRFGTRPEQESFVSDLAHVAAESEKRNFQAPSIIIVGGVCNLYNKLSWFEKRPFFGKGIVVTRAREQASTLVKNLNELGAKVFEFPTIEINSLDSSTFDADIEYLTYYDWVIFTSVNGVKCFCDRMKELKKDARAFAGVSIAAIGPATAEELEKYGLIADFVPEKYMAEYVLEGLLERGIAGKKVLIPRAKVARDVLPESLKKENATVKVLPVYETSLADSDVDEALKEKKIQYITFTSSSTVENFFAKIPKETFDNMRDSVKFVSIGPITSKTLAGYGFKADLEPVDYTIPSLVSVMIGEV